jgi:hypothetical protein
MTACEARQKAATCLVADGQQSQLVIPRKEFVLVVNAL